MLNLLTNPLQTTASKSKVLEVAYELFLEAPQSDYPVIDLHRVAKETGVSLLECRNAIVNANKAGKFPNCSLHT